jgi:hypothetical protein
MLCCSSGIGKAIPKEYRKAAESLFPAGMRKDCLDFAEKLGVGTDYHRFDAGWKNPEELEKLLHSFRNNLELLIQKTWVEKADEDRKEKLLDCVPALIALINERDYYKALSEFGVIAEELAWLLFGSQSREDDFYEYVFRIDHQLGLFWWYGGQLEHFLSSGQKSEETLRSVLLLGICYLTDF